MSDLTIELRVHLIVSVEKIERDTTYIDTPDEGMNCEGREGNIYDYLIAVGIEHALDGHAVEILSFVVGNLLTIHREGLCEVAITIEEAYGTHVYVGV